MVKGKKTVAVALSGGLDSSFAATLLKEEGWDTVGIHLLLPLPDKERTKRIRTAQLLSERINIPLYLVDVEDFFQEEVVGYFVRSYYLGLTPNPCVVCNHVVKFEQIIKWIDSTGIDYLATGHYARVKANPRGSYRGLLKGRDKGKDQSYFLHRLNQAQLTRVLFPLGDMMKAEVYQLAVERGLPRAMLRESQEICFIPDDDYRSFFKRQVNETIPSSGNTVDREGTILGVHPGTYAYTIGQRHGLGIASREPLYVCEIRPRTNEVVVGPRDALFTRTLVAGDFNWIGVQPGKKSMRVQAQIRYRHEAASGTLTVISPDGVQVEFDEPQWAVTPGQALVCYEDQRVLGGGWIRKPI
jgi:tRNA-specific 2-thiouridylase